MKFILLLSLLCAPLYIQAQKKLPSTSAQHHMETRTAPRLEEQFIGCWVTRNPAFFLRLDKDGTFESNDINRQKRKVEHLTGTWLITENVLVLNYNEVATQRLHFMTDKKAWSIKRNDGAVWTKAEAAKCR